MVFWWDVSATGWHVLAVVGFLWVFRFDLVQSDLVVGGRCTKLRDSVSWLVEATLHVLSIGLDVFSVSVWATLTMTLNHVQVI